MRIGHGYDSHRFAEGRKLILGGVEIPHERGLDGHSDADAVAHAVTDALLGAAGLGDIGRHFPPSDAQWKDADSLQLLQRVVRLLEGRNYQIVNVDVTVVAEAPRIGPHAPAMQERLASVLGIAPDHISIKGKSNEGLGWIGRGEGIAAFAVALIDSLEDQDVLHARHRRDASL
ncbi:MAG TPA: 2-C-methyl-D-erythritol 2,4-cyclodiphosphate synthase [Longimicrobium sp.]|nr:2-C-methyl-D-erythritol 2,4-cyclodiphosphate synthase [Longimicrobium sp.]